MRHMEKSLKWKLFGIIAFPEKKSEGAYVYLLNPPPHVELGSSKD